MHANYFELFGLQPSFSLDKSQLTQAYHDIQNQLHPDRYITASSQEHRLAEQKSALVNEAYRVLSDDCSRADYLLTLQDPADKDPSATAGDSDFLSAQMELRQTLEECSASDEYTDLAAHVAEQLQQLAKDFNRLYEQGDYTQARSTQTKMQFFVRFRQQVLAAMNAHDGGPP